MKDFWKLYIEGKHEEVLKISLEHLLEHEAVDRLHVIGLSLVSVGRATEGKILLNAAAVLLPSQQEWFSNASIALLEKCLLQDALEMIDSGLKIHPSNAYMHFNRGNALIALQRFDEAIQAFDTSIGLDENIDSILNKGNCLRKIEKQLEALDCYNRILEMEPDNKAGLLGKAICLADRGKSDEAEPLFASVKDEMPEAAFIYGMLRLSKGDMNGWRYYNERWNCAFAQADRKLYKKPIPTSLAEIQGKTVLLVHEQGFGDSLQFIRFLPMLKKHAKVIVAVPQTLIRLFKRMDSTVDFINGRPEDVDLYDFEIPMLNLPFLLGIKELSDIPNKPYFSASHISLPSKKMRVGLCWAGGNAIPNVNARRSMRLNDFLPLLQADVDFVSLQLGEPAKEIISEWNMAEPLQKKFDYLDTANVITDLDLVITVDTSVAHLAAGMGKPTWILSRYDACWRWLEGRSDTPWYPSAKIYRQPSPKNNDTYSKDWATVVQAVKNDLIVLSSSRSVPKLCITLA